MSLVVGTNTSAQFAQDALRANQNKIATAMQRLSTGLRINSARDDAAGLAISQSMTSQIRGLNQAVRNINDGINLLQTAEGGLGAITDMLQRMRELAVQSANGTNSDAQRAYLQKEAAALQEQIGKVVDTTTWNDKKLLDGSFTGQKIQVGADSGAAMDLSINSAMPVSGGANTYLATKTGNTVGVTPLVTGELVINGTTIGNSTSASAKDVAAAINLQSATTGVTATANATAAPATAIAVTPATFVAPMPGEVSVNVSPAIVSETGSSNLTYTFTRGGDNSNALTVNVAFGGTATAADYTINTPQVLSTSPFNEWTRLQGGTAGFDRSYAVAAGSDGAIYVTGSKGEFFGVQSSDAFLTKYNADGSQAWTKILDSGSSESGEAIKVGIDGSIYLSGWTNGALDGQANRGNGDAFLTKFDANGNKAWTKLFGTNSADAATALTIGLDGAIYVGGAGGALDGQTVKGGADSFLVKFDAAGNKIWTRLLGGDGGEDVAFALTTGLDGSIYMTGVTDGQFDGQTNNGSRDAYLTKYDTNGNKIWSRIFGSSWYENGRALTTGLDGSIYVTGWTGNGASESYLKKYDSNGTQQWSQLLGGGSRANAYGITTGIDGAIYVSGDAYGSLDGQLVAGNIDAFLARYNPDGTRDWTRLLGSANTYTDARALATGTDGSIYMSGFTDGAHSQVFGGSYDGFVSKFSLSPQITFAAGSTTATLVLAPTSDSQVEGGETLTVSVVAGTGYQVGTATAAGTIIDSAAYTFGVIASDAIRINGINIGAIATAVSGNERANQMLTAINAQTSSTGVIATINVATGGISLSAADGRNIEISTLTSAQIVAGDIGIALNGTSSGNRTITTYRSAVTLSSTSQTGITISASGAASAASGLTSGTTAPSVNITPAWDISTAASASSTIGAIDSTLDSVNSTRSNIGSYINRLNYAGDNATNISTNLSASRSTIMDTDYAEESANLAKSQIIQQAATAMLAQANQQPQSVLALLKNL